MYGSQAHHARGCVAQLLRKLFFSSLPGNDMHKIILILTAALTFGVATGVASPQQPVIAVFTKNFTNPAYEAARVAADRVAREFGAKTIHYVPEKPDNVEQQKLLVEKALKDRPDIVLFTPVDDVAMIGDLEKFAAAKIPVVLFINPMQGQFVTFVGSDDVEVGYLGAKALFQALGGKGQVVAIEGNPGAPTSRDRVKGMNRALAEFPGIQLLDSGIGMYQRSESKKLIARMVLKYPRIDGIWAANDVMAFGALDALGEAGRTAKIVGANGLDEAIKDIEDGVMLASVDFSSFKLACVATEAAIRHLRGQPVPKTIKVPVLLIDKSNYQAWKTPITQRPCPAWGELVH
jgi:ribose transport system substrate-binding protein